MENKKESAELYKDQLNKPTGGCSKMPEAMMFKCGQCGDLWSEDVWPTECPKCHSTDFMRF